MALMIDSVEIENIKMNSLKENYIVKIFGWQTEITNFTLSSVNEFNPFIDEKYGWLSSIQTAT